MYRGTGETLCRESLGTRLGLQIRLLGMRENMIHDTGREKWSVHAKVKGRTLNLFSWCFRPCENLAQEIVQLQIRLASFPGNIQEWHRRGTSAVKCPQDYHWGSVGRERE